MPRLIPNPPELDALIARQHRILTRRQALEHLNESTVAGRLGREWKVVLPGVYAAQRGALDQVQRQEVGLLHAGPNSMLDDTTALRLYDVRYLPEDTNVRVLTPANNQRTSRDFVALRRTIYLPNSLMTTHRQRIAPLARALTDFALRHDDERTVLAVLASAVQRRQVLLDELDTELAHAPARGRLRLVRVLEHLHAGIRSAPESDIRVLVESSAVLPRPLYNCLLQLPDGRKISPDLLIEEAALVHEMNGRMAHAEEDQFESMQERHDALTTAGLTALHNSPRMAWREGRRILRQLETCYLRDAGKGLPPGVVILRRTAA